MDRVLRMAAMLMALVAGPALAQTPATRTPAPRTPAPAAAPASAPAASGKRIDVNSASETELDALSGIGASRAKSIVAHRPYETVDELVSKQAITASQLGKVRGRVALANINTSTARDMQRTLPGVGDVRAGQIVTGRPYATPQDLVSKGVLTQALFDKIKDVVTY